jgi:hypothetical protein
MTRALATYSFLPWLRQGLAAQITTPDTGAPGGLARATVRVVLEVTGEPMTDAVLPVGGVERDVQLYSPGDIIGIDSRAVIRTEPRDWITNYEPNYMPAIEFYDEDFPWRYTPAAPDASRLRLRPWIALVVLEEEIEFHEGRNMAGKPLPYIDVNDAKTLPSATELWAWAHVHVNRSLAASDEEFASTDMSAVLPRLTAVLREDPDLAYSRIVCPRHLKPNTPYHAFLVPVFETGRLAGLGLDPAAAPSVTASAWGAAGGVSLPVYYRWYFRSGGQGDFEFLVRLLRPQEVDHRVGVRDIDVRTPGALLPGINGNVDGVLKLGGALRVPRSSITGQELVELLKYEQWADVAPHPHPFQAALARFIDLPDDYGAAAAGDANAASGLGAEIEAGPDPLITAPLYACWHALVKRLLLDRDGVPVTPDDNWVHELNLDPRHRTAAGFGTRVVQTKQEDYVAAAWAQIGDVLEANRRIRQAQLGMLTSIRWYDHQLMALEPGQALNLTAPVQRHVLADGATVDHRRSLSVLTPPLTSPAMRRVARPRGRLMRALPFTSSLRPNDLLERVNSGAVVIAPPKVTPGGLPTTDAIADRLVPASIPPTLVRLLRSNPWLSSAAALLALLVLGLIASFVLAGSATPVVPTLGVLFVLFVVLAAWLWRLSALVARADFVREDNLTGEALDRLPSSPDFVIREPGSGAAPHSGDVDSPQAVRFRKALREWYELHRASATASTRPAALPIDLESLASKTLAAIDPRKTIPRRILTSVVVPDRIRLQLAQNFGEVMAYPVLDQPMYEPLENISEELFLPNLNLIAQNSITLLETNQKFIESYMVGLNHEFARELLWREYPTDQRGSYFRQFWDVRGVLDAEGLPPEALTEKLRDIPELHRWAAGSALGDHDHREKPGEDGQELVLVIRGELLKKYPNAVIYAHKAAWAMKNGKIDLAQERSLKPFSEAEEEKPPSTTVLTPLYEARVDPDITFLGFDLTVPDARGDSGEHPKDSAGWFFVIKERPGEPRFGFDVGGGGPIQTVNDIGWEDAALGAEFASANALAGLALAPLGASDVEKTEQHAEDQRFLAAPSSSARWAYILYQAPVMVAVHATEMLPRPV